MKISPILLTLCLGFSLAIAQNQETPEISYRVEKQYDEKGNLIRYDSTQVTGSSNFSKQFSFIISKDSLENASQLNFSKHRKLLDSLHTSFQYDSLFNERMFLLTSRMKDMNLDSIMKLEFFFKDGVWMNEYQPNMKALEKRIEALDSLMQNKMDRFEELFDRFEKQLQKKI